MKGEKHERKFKGVWIPREIWESTEITWMEKCLLAEIDSFSGDDGCYASNEYLATMLGSTTASIANQISRLRKAGFLETVSFDGRERVLKVTRPLTEELSLDQPGGEEGLNQAVIPYIRENKVENKEGCEFPENLRTPAFKEAWEDWKAFRKESRKPLTPTAIKTQLRDLSGYGHKGAIASIHTSISANWIGLFPPKPVATNGHSNGYSQPPRQAPPMKILNPNRPQG